MPSLDEAGALTITAVRATRSNSFKTAFLLLLITWAVKLKPQCFKRYQYY